MTVLKQSVEIGAYREITYTTNRPVDTEGDLDGALGMLAGFFAGLKGYVGASLNLSL